MDVPSHIRLRWKKMSSLAGAFMAFLPNGFTMYWGNLSVYVYSFIYVMNSVDPLQNQAPWLISLYIIARNVGVISARQLMRCLGPRLTMLVAIFVFNASLFSCYWLVHSSTWVLNTSLGLLTGLANGILHAVIMVYVIDWSGSNVGFLTSAVMTGYSVGSALTNEGITLYVNPANEKINRHAGPIGYFSQRNVLDTVPKIFIVLSIFSISCHLIGCLLIRQCDTTSTCNSVVKENASGICDEVSGGCVSKEERCKYQKASVLGSCLPEDMELEEREQRQPFLYINNTDGSDPDVDLIDTKVGVENVKDFQGHAHGLSSSSEEEQGECKNATDKDVSKSLQNDNLTSNHNDSQHGHEFVHPSTDVKRVKRFKNDVLRLFITKDFYVLFIVMLATDISSFILTTYYKTFGQCWIKNDHFLTTLGTTLSVVTTAARLLWGLVMDKLGVKVPTVLSLSALTAVSSVYYLTPAASQWLFLAATLLLGCANSAVFTSFHVGTIHLLGRRRFTTNYGILSFSGIWLNVVAPPVVDLVLTRHGWFGLFLGTALTAGLALLLVTFLMALK